MSSTQTITHLKQKKYTSLTKLQFEASKYEIPAFQWFNAVCLLSFSFLTDTHYCKVDRYV